MPAGGRGAWLLEGLTHHSQILGSYSVDNSKGVTVSL